MLADLDLPAAPSTMTMHRTAGSGWPTIDIRPAPRKSIAPLTDALRVLVSKSAGGTATKRLNNNPPYSSEADPRRYFDSDRRALIVATEAIASGSTDSFGEEALDAARRLLESLEDAPRFERLRAAVSSVLDWHTRPDPTQEACTRLWKRTPDILMFDEPDRSLLSAYGLDDQLVQSPPKALANLLGTAELDLNALLQYVQNGDIARRDSALARANTSLGRLFRDAWNQSRLSVRLAVDGQTLRVTLWEDGDHITVFDERSAGLRMFVALIVFLKVHNTDRPPILLIDEAENHLHLDAQADLVNTFFTQDKAAKVIYTTHSPACLPPDLGSGIRCVVPDRQTQLSNVENSFWKGSAGYSPLMVAMGAAAAAFTPARYVVLAEGASDMLLLPTLIRSAVGVESLPYQIAPGLSEVPSEFLPMLDLEGARVVYLVDGDAGGESLIKRLRVCNVPNHLIVRHKACGVENLLTTDDYWNAISALVPECNEGRMRPLVDRPTLPGFNEASWATTAERWLRQVGLQPPSKVAVANWLVQNCASAPSKPGVQLLRKLHLDLKKALKLESGD